MKRLFTQFPFNYTFVNYICKRFVNKKKRKKKIVTTFQFIFPDYQIEVIDDIELCVEESIGRIRSAVEKETRYRQSRPRPSRFTRINSSGRDVAQVSWPYESRLRPSVPIGVH